MCSFQRIGCSIVACDKPREIASSASEPRIGGYTGSVAMGLPACKRPPRSAGSANSGVPQPDAQGILAIYGV